MVEKPKPLVDVFRTKRLRKKVKRVFRDSFEKGYTKEEDIVNTAVYLIKEKMREIKQRIEQACKFYLKYKDKPELLVKDYSEYKEEVDKLWLKWRKKKPSIHSAKEDFLKDYNEWLFKLAFKDVLEGER